MDQVQRAVKILRGGGVVAIPTETVYGLAGDASSRASVEKIYAVKGRPLDHPVIVHVADAQEAARWALEISPQARQLMEKFWPGPLTLILPKAPHVGAWVTGGQDTVGLRVPSHPLTLELLRQFGGGLAAPSANRFGRISPTTAAHVHDDLGSDVDLILDGGPCEVGLESTIVDLSDSPRILRPGRIGVAELERILGPLNGELAGAPRAPGMLASHYAPGKATRFLRDGYPLEGNALLSFGPIADGGKCAAWENLGAQPHLAAQGLYAALRRLDAGPGQTILIQPPPEGGGWNWIADRLGRAVSVRD